MSAPARVTAGGWGWRYAGRRLPAVSDVTFTIEPGERVLLLGASGAGKSTLLAGLAGVLGDAEEGERTGSLLVDGAAPESRRGHIGLVLQDPDAGVVLSKVGDDVAFGCENLAVPPAEIRGRVAEAMDAVGLDVALDHPTKALSGGQKQRLALAGVLAMRPGLLLLDEPTANLDPEGVREVRDSVARVLDDSGATLVVVEHRTEIWTDLLTRVIVLAADGGLLADGAPGKVFREYGDALADAGVWVPDHDIGLAALGPVSSADAADAVLQTRDLAVTRDRHSAVQEHLELVVPRGAATLITGPNGAGKSTLALTLAGLLAELEGVVESAPDLAGRGGRRPSKWTSRELLRRIGTVFQEPEHQFLSRTLRDELAVGPRALGMSKAQVDAIVDDLLDRLQLAPLGLANPFTLSGGQKRRLSVATVLAASPQIMVLDEPTFGQDRRGWIGIVELLQDEISAGRTVIAVSHDDQVIRHLGGQRIQLEAAGAR